MTEYGYTYHPIAQTQLYYFYAETVHLVTIFFENARKVIRVT